MKYISKCCNAEAKKPALKRIPNWRDAQPTEFGGLGKWRCTHCRKHCAVVAVATANS